MLHPVWYRRRGYLHFDEPMSLEKAQALVENPDAVSKHAFWPLISYQKQTIKIKEDSNSGAIFTKLKDRKIAYAAHSDSHILSYYCQLLGNKYEERIRIEGISDSVLAFRALNKSNIDFAKQAIDEIRRQGNCTAIALDIIKFFDNLEHKHLKQSWKELLGVRDLPPDHFAVFKAVTKNVNLNRDKLYELLNISIHKPRSGGRRRLCEPIDFRERVRSSGLVQTNALPIGIPQGTAISAMLW